MKQRDMREEKKKNKFEKRKVFGTSREDKKNTFNCRKVSYHVSVYIHK